MSEHLEQPPAEDFVAVEAAEAAAVVELEPTLSARLEHYQRDFVVPVQQLQQQARRARATNALFGNVAPDMVGKSEFVLKRIEQGLPEAIVKYRNP